MANTLLQGRIWSKVLYPEDYENWDVIVENLRDTHLEVMISPVHTPDEKDEKDHRHIIIFCDSNKTIRNMNDLFTKITDKECKYVEKVESERGMIRYLIHRDHPNKQQFINENGEYDIQTILCLNNCTDRRDKAFKEESEQVRLYNLMLIEDTIDQHEIENIIILRRWLMELGFHEICRELYTYNIYYLKSLMDGYYQLHKRFPRNPSDELC